MSWGNNDSFPGNAPAHDSRQSNPEDKSSCNSTAFYSLNTAASLHASASMLRNNNHNNGVDVGGGGAGKPSALGFDWLTPWRTPQDCREGGMALLLSMQEILMNVQRARLSSLNEVYSPVRGNTVATGGELSRDASELREEMGGDASTLRLSMRSSKRRTRLTSFSSGGTPTAAAVAGSGGEVEAEGQVKNGSMTNGGGIQAGATLMDYMVLGSSTRRTSHMWLDASTLPMPKAADAVSEEATEKEGKPRDSLQRQTKQGERRRSFLQSAEEAPPSTTSAAAAAAHTLPEKKGNFAPPAVIHPGRRTTAQGGDPLSMAEPSTTQHTPSAAVAVGAVPPIPRFDEVRVAQKAYQKQQQQAQQQPHPRSEAAQRKARALLHSSDDDDGKYDTEDYDDHDGSPRANLQATARLAPDAGAGAARPAPLPRSSHAYAESSSFSHHGVESEQQHARDEASAGRDANDDFSFSDVDEEEMDEGDDDSASDHISATNFGEGGHLACVPGDTLHNRYTLLKALGVGRSSRVWLAVDLEQCSLARRQLIREWGEREARRLFRPHEHPMFVAIKVFRCGAMYADCATYEAKLSTFLKDSVKLRQLRGTRSPLSRSLSLVVSPTAAKHGGNNNNNNNSNSVSFNSQVDGGSFGAAAHPRKGGSRANSNTSLIMSLPAALMSAGDATAAAAAATANNASSLVHANHTYNSIRSNNAAGAASLTHPSTRLTTFRDAFTVEGQYGTHQCLVMDVLGSGVDKAINETHLAGFPSEVARSIMLSSLQGLSILAACNVIHTDLKPENLLFVDLEAAVAAEMSAFQASQLQTGQRSGLWSSFTHRRESVLDYSQRLERGEGETASHAVRTVDNSSGGGGGSSSSGRHSQRDSIATTHEEKEGEAEDGARQSGSACNRHIKSEHRLSVPAHAHSHSSNSTVVEERDEKNGSAAGGRGSSSLNSPSLSATRRRRGSAASMSLPHPRRLAYEVRVTDFGLSFITPPCLRLGVQAMVRYTEEVGITEDELVNDDPLSQLQWLYEQQQQLHPLSGVRRNESCPLEHIHQNNNSSVGGDSGRSLAPGCEFGRGGVFTEAAAAPVWRGEGDLIEEAELRALQLEEARDDDERVRHKSDTANRQRGERRIDDDGESEEHDDDVDYADAGEETEKKERRDAPRRGVVAAPRTAASAAEFASVLDVGVGAEPSQRGAKKTTTLPSKAAAVEERLRQQTTQPDHAHLHTDCSVHRSSASTNDSLEEHRGVMAADTTESNFLVVRPAAPVPPIALSTASYHSPVSHPLTAQPSVTAIPTTGLQYPDHCEHARVNYSLSLTPRNHDQSRHSCSKNNESHNLDSGSNSSFEGNAQRNSGSCEGSEVKGRAAVRNTPSPPQQQQQQQQQQGLALSPSRLVAAPVLLNRQSSAVEDAAEAMATASNDAVKSETRSSFARPSALHFPALTDPSSCTAATEAKADRAVRKSTSEEKEDDRGGRPTRMSALVSPHRSPTSALASLIALRRLELSIVRSQHYTRGATIQSREYRAPEVLLGNFFLPSCDVWSMGCIAYELVTGRFLMDCIADREHFGRQLALHLREEERKKEEKEERRHHESGAEDAEEAEEVEWDGKPIYLDDDEQDLDVFHLKSMIRLLGPPPISYLNQRPIGLYVDDYFDQRGHFNFWEDGEAEECGVGLADVYRRAELRYWGGRRPHSSGSATASSGGGGGCGAATTTTSGLGDNFSLKLRSANTNDDYFFDEEESEEVDNDGEEERDNSNRHTNNTAHVGEEGLGLRMRHYSSLNRINDPVDPQAHLFSSSGIPTPSTLSTTSRGCVNSAISAHYYQNPHHMMTPATTPTSARPAGGGSVSVGGGTSLHSPPQQLMPHPSPHSTRNYPIETPDWVEVTQLIRQKLKSSEETQDFVSFLRKCLQWDPAQRATAAELLADDWMVKYSHKLAETVNSDADDDDYGVG